MRDEDEYRRRVVEVVSAEGIEVLIPGLDPELPVLAGMRDELADLGCTVIVSDPDVIAVSDDKLATAEWSSSLGLPFVATRALPDAQDHADELDYPVIVKPRRGSSSFGIRLAHDAASLRNEARDDQMVVQPFLPPRDRSLALMDDTGAPANLDQLHEVSAQYVVGASGRILGTFVSLNRLRLGIPVQIEPVVDAAWVDDGRSFVEALVERGARGPINLQGRLDADGHVQFFELNARFTGITGVRTMMGFREVEATVRALALDDEDGAARALAFDDRLVGLRHVGDMVVGGDRIDELQHEGSLRASRRRPSARRVVVSGASSYIGRSTVATLVAGDVEEVHALVRSEAAGVELAAEIADSRLHVHRVDLLDDTIELPPADVVLHLAGVRAANDAPPFLFEVNVEGTRRLLRGSPPGRRRPLRVPVDPGRLRSRSPTPVGRVPAAAARDAVRDEQVARRGDVPRAGGRGDAAAGAARRSRLRMCARHALGGAAARVRPQDRQGRRPHHPRRRQPAHGSRARPRHRRRAPPVHDGRAAGSRTHGAEPRRGHPVSLRELATTYTEVATTLGLDPPPVEHAARTGVAPSFGMHVRRARAVLGWSPATSLTDAVRELVEAAL